MRSDYPTQKSSTREPLKQGSPLNELPDFNKKPNLEKVGTAIALSQSVVTQKYGSNTPDGTRQMSAASKIPMSDKPHLGYESASTPVSDRARESKRVY